MAYRIKVTTDREVLFLHTFDDNMSKWTSNRKKCLALDDELSANTMANAVVMMCDFANGRPVNQVEIDED